MENCYIEFRVKDNCSLARINSIVEVIKRDKENEIEDYADKWIHLFNEKELDDFWWPTQEEFEQTRKMLGEVYIKVVANNSDKYGDWDIYSMFESIMNAELEIIGVRLLNKEFGRLEFNPFAYPHGGTECLEKLVGCTRNIVIASDSGIGRVEVTTK
ncbi:hypothetical protein [Pseudobacteroides cellulosolvens]|uniref:Uncharacterized protein n=1 Tax=Pseudobacteroides cellulosolvens ATCC 35603 = DSM 2933 TaxID=398512 RepID=A0A0L6JPF3_9FIRM|nr:hypothetical protein [Pseudobacteroides cellulosolvens]KNY27595.1 hypothetical protein Bccel_2866 [Pseudobacteroides cellulosolvens ATCC 35603 = DSM 2933]